MAMNKTQQELKAWFERWWSRLPTPLFTSKNKGNKKRCYKQVEDLNPDQELRDKIDTYTQEKSRAWKKLIADGVRVDPWQHAERMIKNEFWDDDLPCISEAKQTGIISTIACDETGCVELRHGPAYTKCSVHQALSISEQNGDTQLLRDKYKQLKLHKLTPADMVKRCKKLCGKLGVDL